MTTKAQLLGSGGIIHFLIGFAGDPSKHFMVILHARRLPPDLVGVSPEFTRAPGRTDLHLQS